MRIRGAVLVVPLFLYALIELLSHPAVNQAPCNWSYCVSLSATMSVGGDATFSTALAILSVVQTIALTAAIYQAIMGLASVGGRVPAALLAAASRARGFSDVHSQLESSEASVFGLSIESITGGRLTSKMQRSPGLLGVGRPGF